jgi:hypothetical protein
MRRVRITPDFPKLVISDDGKIQSLTRRKPIWLKPRLNKYGYPVVSYLHKPVPVHTLVCTAYHGSKPSEDHQVAHNNGDPTDNRADNLRWATSQENHDDMVLHGTVLKGSANGRALFSEQQVKEIRSSSESGYSIAKRLGISQSTISLIRNRKSWRHI